MSSEDTFLLDLERWRHFHFGSFRVAGFYFELKVETYLCTTKLRLVVEVCAPLSKDLLRLVLCTKKLSLVGEVCALRS